MSEKEEPRRLSVVSSFRLLNAAVKVAAELEARAAGAPPDRRFDPAIDALLDEAERQEREQ